MILQLCSIWTPQSPGRSPVEPPNPVESSKNTNNTTLADLVPNLSDGTILSNRPLLVTES